MAFTNYIQQITATSGTTHDLVDTSASHYIKGTQTQSTNAWTGALPDGVSAYYDGLSIDYFLPYAGTSSAATLNLGGKGAKPVYYGNGTGAVTTHYPQYSVIHLTYIVNSNLNSGNGCWKADAYYNTNTTYSAGTGISLSGTTFSNSGVTSITTSAGTHSTKSSATGAVSFNVPTKTSHLTNDSGFLTQHQTAVNSLTTTAGTHSTVSSKTGAVSIAIPTKTSHLTNDSGYITSSHTSTYSLPVAKYNTLGGVKPAYSSTNAATLTDTAATNTTTPTIAAKSTTSGRYYAVEIDKNGILFVNVPWTNVNSSYLTSSSSLNAAKLTGTVPSGCYTNSNTTYTLTNALASHKFTWTFTAGGSGSGSTTTTAELVAGTGITLTDDTTNKKITIACSVTDTDTKVTQAYSTTSSSYPLLMTATAGVSSTASRGATTAVLNNSLYYIPSSGTLKAGNIVKINNWTWDGATAGHLTLSYTA